jgi:peptide deformylase
VKATAKKSSEWVDVDLRAPMLDTQAMLLEDSNEKRKCIKVVRNQYVLCGVIRVRGLVNCIFYGLFVCFIMYVVLWLPHQRQRSNTDTFKPSSVVFSAEERQEVEATYKLKLAYFMANSKSCGVALPHLRVYRQYAMIRIDDRLMELFNPSFIPIMNYLGMERQYEVKETSLLCKNATHTSAKRYSDITASWDTLTGTRVEMPLYDSNAVCFQHLVEVFKGDKWPCDDPSQRAIPFMFNIINPLEHEL